MQSLVEYFVCLLLALLIQLIPQSRAFSSAEIVTGKQILKKEHHLETPVLLCNQQKDYKVEPELEGMDTEAIYRSGTLSTS